MAGQSLITAFLLANNAKTTLAANIPAVAPGTSTIIQVSAGTGKLFPNNPTITTPFQVTLTAATWPSSAVLEVGQCIAINGDFLTVIRGQEGTTPVVFNVGDIIELNLTAAVMNYYANFPQTTNLALAAKMNLFQQ